MNLQTAPNQTSPVDETIATVVESPVPTTSSEQKMGGNKDNNLHKLKPSFVMALFKSLTDELSTV